MKGRKIDQDFVTEYISKCLEDQISSVSDVVARAKNRISEIDQFLYKIDCLKSERSKLMDVVSMFDDQKKKSSIDDINKLNLFKMKNHNLCKDICVQIKISPDGLFSKNLMPLKYSVQEINFCIKQLVANEVISIGDDGKYIKGNMFSTYLNML